MRKNRTFLSDFNFERILLLIAKLNDLGVLFIKIRDLRKNPLYRIEEILKLILKKKGIEGVEILIKEYKDHLKNEAMRMAKDINALNRNPDYISCISW